jgi:biopolymer transport protein ExbB/TolQ/cellobiose-specific phosphotransferase system component IIA
MRLIGRSSAALKRLTSEGDTISGASRVDWLAESWAAEPATVRSSWLGNRIEEALEMQQSRGRRNNLEQDLNALSEQTANQQYESYSLLRIVHWAMPMLGFLGTVLGISQTLGQLDMEMLNSQQQAAMNQLTDGLYVAFDTTAIALVLTVISMFIQFAVNRVELNLMERVDRESDTLLIPFLTFDPFDAQDSLLTPVREMASDLVNCVRELVVEQAALWTRSITESQRQWSDWTQKLASEVDTQLVSALGEAMSKHLEGLERVEEKTGRQFETRLQQWQTTLSEQTRALHAQQKEMVLQTTTLHQLIQSTADLKKLEEAISNNLRTIEEAGKLDQASGRIENATHCVGEAVAMLATSLERAGLVRPAPKRPRPVNKVDAASSDPAIVPFPGSASEGSDQPSRIDKSDSSTIHTHTRRGEAA